MMKRLLLLPLVVMFACGSPIAPTPPPAAQAGPVTPAADDTTTVTVSLNVVAMRDPSQKLAGVRVGMAPWDGGAATPPGQQLTNADGFATWRVEPGRRYIGVIQGVVLIDRELVSGTVHWTCYYDPIGGPTTRCERT